MSLRSRAGDRSTSHCRPTLPTLAPEGISRDRIWWAIQFPDGWTKTYGPAGLYFDPRAFAAPAQYSFGNLGRNAVRGPGFKNFDLGMFKNFNFTEQWRLQFRAEAFNAFNNTNFSNPGGSFGTPNFGRSTGTANAQRSIQLGLKLYF